MKYKDFEDFLMSKHGEQYTGFDDDMPDDYENWLTELDVEEWLRLGELYAIKFAQGHIADLKSNLLKNV